MKKNPDLDASALGAGWRVLRRHLRYAAGDPRKLMWIARRALQILIGGQLQGVLQRHRLVEDFYRDYAAWTEVAERDAAQRTIRYAQQAAHWSARPRFSVLLPVYRPLLPMLEQAIQSVLDQAYP